MDNLRNMIVLKLTETHQRLKALQIVNKYIIFFLDGMTVVPYQLKTSEMVQTDKKDARIKL